jgi:hypothetical protein
VCGKPIIDPKCLNLLHISGCIDVKQQNPSASPTLAVIYLKISAWGKVLRSISDSRVVYSPPGAGAAGVSKRLSSRLITSAPALNTLETYVVRCFSKPAKPGGGKPRV